MRTTELERETKRAIACLRRLRYDFRHGDRRWSLLFPARGAGGKGSRWHQVSVVAYADRFYFNWLDERASLESDAAGRFKLTEGDAGEEDWSALLRAARDHGERVLADWPRANRALAAKLPERMRYGLVPRRVLWRALKGAFRPDLELGAEATRRFVELFETREFAERHEGLPRDFTLARYLDYCRRAYSANAGRYRERIDPRMSGARMYGRMADGRHEGLLELAPASPEAWEGWYRGRQGGGHPWEICRGGNTTHIDLGVREDKAGWSVFVAAPATSRMAEAVRMALALHEAGMPVHVVDAEGYRLRLLGQDNVGVLPHYVSPHRANELFAPEDRVFDAISYDELGRAKAKVRPFIAWKPLDLLVPGSMAAK